MGAKRHISIYIFLFVHSFNVYITFMIYKIFYYCSIEFVLTFLSVASLSLKQKNCLQVIIKFCSKIAGRPLAVLQELQNIRSQSKAQAMLIYQIQSLWSYFNMLLSRHRHLLPYDKMHYFEKLFHHQNSFSWWTKKTIQNSNISLYINWRCNDHLPLSYT